MIEALHRPAQWLRQDPSDLLDALIHPLELGGTVVDRFVRLVEIAELFLQPHFGGASIG